MFVEPPFHRRGKTNTPLGTSPRGRNSAVSERFQPASPTRRLSECVDFADPAVHAMVTSSPYGDGLPNPGRTVRRDALVVKRRPGSRFDPHRG